MSFKLTPELRALSLLAFCSLASACGVEAGDRDHSRGAAARQAPSVASPASTTQKERSSPKPAEPQLSALAPSTPRSILDDKPSGDVSRSDGFAVEPQGRGKDKSAKDDAEQTAPELDAPVSLEHVKVDRFVLATDVEQREPVGESERFTTETPKIFAFMQFANGDAPFAVKVYWEKVGDPASPYGVELQVPTAMRHRTWSWTKIRREPGSYRAVVRTLDGRELVSKEFVIEAEQPH
jgi:hypothetical protein